MNLLALIERHRNDLNPHPRMRMTLTTEQITNVINQIIEEIPDLSNIPEASDAMPKATTFGVAGSPGTEDPYARADHRHPLTLPDAMVSLASLGSSGWIRKDGSVFSARDGSTAIVDVLVNYDPKTGLLRHHRLTYDRGQLMTSQIGPWHPFQEELAAMAGTVTPSAGADPDGAYLFHRVSDALTYDADADNVLLAPAILEELLVIDDVAETALVTVPANKGSLWYGCVLPIRFRNNATSDTPRQWVIQIRDATGVPAGHHVMGAITNKHNAETPWWLNLPHRTTSDDDAAVMGYGGEMTVFVFLGLGLDTNGTTKTPSLTPYSIQVDGWLV